MNLFFLSIVIVMSIFVKVYVIVACSVGADDVATFKYTNHLLLSKVGKSVTPLKPIVDGRGTFEADPELPSGIELDKETGIISGVAKKKYLNSHDVIFRREDGKVLKANLDIKVDEAAAVVSCGIIELNLYGSLTEEITCKCTKPTARLVAEYSPATVATVNLIDGVLKFDNYVPDGDLVITISAYDDDNGENPEAIIASTVINVKNKGEYINGMKIEAKKLGVCMCNSPNRYFDAKYDGTVDYLDGLDVDDGYAAWDNKLFGFLSSYKVKYLGVELSGKLNIETEGTYKFVIQSDNSQYNVKIDNAEVYKQKESVYIAEDGEYTSLCAVWNLSRNEFEVQLASGYHDVAISGYYFTESRVKHKTEYEKYIYFDISYRFNLKWFKNDIETTVPFLTSPTYSLVSGLAFESNYYTVPINATTEILFTLERGPATQCTGSFNSENVYVDVFKHVLKVTSNVETSIEFSISCSTISSVTNSVNIKIDFINKFVKGIVGYYMKDSNFNPSLIEPMLPSDEGVRVEIIKLESSVNHPYIEKPTIWDGLNHNFVNQFGVNWDGYLYISNDDEYRFNLTSFHASWLYIDYDEVINNYGIKYDVVTSKYGNKYLKEGYHFIRIVYTKNIGGSGILVAFRSSTKEDDSKYRDLNNNLYFVPRGDFEYTVSYAVYFADEMIPTNVPIVYDNKEISECTSDPELPKGLSFESDCRITGTPEAVQDYTTYTVTGKLNDADSTIVSCTLTIKVGESIIPQNLHLKDLSTNLVVEKEFYVKYGFESRYLLEVDSGTVTYYEIKPVIDGFHLEAETGNLYITMNEYLENEKIDIIAHYDKSSMISRSYNFTVVSPCSGEKTLHHLEIVLERYTPTCFITLKYANDEIIIDDQMIQIDRTSSMGRSSNYCIVPGTLLLYFYTGKLQGSYQIYVYNDGILVDTINDSKNYNTHTISSLLKPPVLSYPSTSYVFYNKNNVNIKPKVNYVRSCSITPDLPPSFQFNKLDCSILGTVNESYPMTLFIITAKNAAGVTEANFTMTLYDEDIQTTCRKLGKTFLTLNFHGFDPANYWSYLVYRTADIDKVDRKAVINLNGNTLEWTYGDYYYEFCIDEDKYTVVHKDTDGQGFSYFFMLTSINQMPIVKASLARDQMEYSQNINTISNFNYFSKWEYSYQYFDGWDDINRITSKWSESTLSELSNNNGITTYIRKIDSYKDTGEFSAYLLKVRYLSGILIKINGKELFRNNLPLDVEIKPTDFANGKYDEMVDEVFALPISMFDEVDRAIISIELHKNSDETTNFPQIDVSLTGVIGDKQNCLVLNKFANKITETNTNVVYADYAFDESLENSWDSENIFPAWAIMRYRDHFHCYFNQLSLTTTHDEWYLPTVISMDGYDRDVWTELAKFENIKYNNKKVIFPNYNMTKMYSAIKISIHESNNKYSFDIKEINIHLCPLRFCLAVDDLPITATGDIVELNCSNTESTEGSRKFLCENDKQWKEIENTCNEGPKFLSYESSYEFKAGSIYKDVLLYLVSGNNLEFSMNPTIDGLKLDKSTGVISGQPVKETPAQSYTFTVKNKYDTIGKSVSIMLSVKASNVPVKIWSNDTVTIESGKEYKLQLFLVAGSNLEYKVDKLPSGFVMDPETGIISGTTFEEVETEIQSKFVVGNEEDNIIINVLIKVILPVKPVIVKYDKEISVIYGEVYEMLQPFRCLAKTIAYSVEPKLLENLNINPNTGIISGKVNVEPINTTSFTYIFKCYNGNDESSISKEVIIHVKRSVAPVIISHVDSITVDGGIEYESIELCNVTGENLGYSIIPKPPVDTLKFDEFKGTLSGYTPKYFEPVNLTVMISGSGKEATFSFTLKSKILEDPVIVNSTIVSDIVLDFGQTATVIKRLFTVVGDNIKITVTPELPRGLNLNEKTGEISGIPLEYVDEMTYTFIVTNEPSPVKQEVKIKISFKSVMCEADSGFPSTIAEKGGKEVSIKCGGASSGMKIRKCYLTDDGRGIWSTVDETECSMSSGAIAGIAIGSVAVGLIVIIGVVFCLLRTGIFTKKAKSKSSSKGPHRIDVNDKAVRI